MATVTDLAGLASFDDDWTPEAYLGEFYTEVQHDERITLEFLGAAAARIGPVPDLLEVGCGPTVHHLFPFAATAARLHVADYLPCNLDRVRRWVAAADDAWDWSPFARHALEVELGRTVGTDEVAAREAVTRRRIASYRHADVRRPLPLGGLPRRFPAVLCCFCPDSITDDLGEWRRCTANVASLVAPGGWFVLAALGSASSYRVGTRRYPSAGVTAADVAGVLAATGFDAATTTVTSVGDVDAAEHGYQSVVLAVGRRSGPTRCR